MQRRNRWTSFVPRRVSWQLLQVRSFTISCRGEHGCRGALHAMLGDADGTLRAVPHIVARLNKTCEKADDADRERAIGRAAGNILPWLGPLHEDLNYKKDLVADWAVPVFAQVWQRCTGRTFPTKPKAVDVALLCEFTEAGWGLIREEG